MSLSRKTAKNFHPGETFRMPVTQQQSLGFPICRCSWLPTNAYIVKLAEGGEFDSAGVNSVIRGMGNFACGTTPPGDSMQLLQVAANCKAENAHGEIVAPDAALKWIFPLQRKEGPLRAPLVAEIHSLPKSVFAVLQYLGNFLQLPVVEYLLHIRFFNKISLGNFGAVAILWRKNPTGGAATCVLAQSFGTRDLPEDSVKVYEEGLRGVLAGVPVGSLKTTANPPPPIVIPGARPLQNVTNEHGDEVLKTNQHFLPPNTIPDLVIGLEDLRDRVSKYSPKKM